MQMGIAALRKQSMQTSSNSTVGVGSDITLPSNEPARGDVAVTAHVHVAIAASSASSSATVAAVSNASAAQLHGGLGNDTSEMASCPFSSAHRSGGDWATPEMQADERVPLFDSFSGGDFSETGGSVRLLADIGGGDRIRELFTLFYVKAFQDVHLDAFMFESDGAEEHGRRFGDWLVEKMGGEGAPWSDSGRHGSRAATHRQAWESRRRPRQLQGRRFKVHDCVVWMRLLFWAGRELHLDEHNAFWYWFVSFIQHFIAVYERAAQPHTVAAARWSASADNIQRYLDDGRWMTDALHGVSKADVRTPPRAHLICMSVPQNGRVIIDRFAVHK